MPRLEIAGGQTDLDPFVSFFSLSLSHHGQDRALTADQQSHWGSLLPILMART